MPLGTSVSGMYAAAGGATVRLKCVCRSRYRGLVEGARHGPKCELRGRQDVPAPRVLVVLGLVRTPPV